MATAIYVKRDWMLRSGNASPMLGSGNGSGLLTLGKHSVMASFSPATVTNAERSASPLNILYL